MKSFFFIFCELVKLDPESTQPALLVIKLKGFFVFLNYFSEKEGFLKIV